MKITCESCSAKYTIADDKVRGRKVKIRCKGCGTPIVVDGQASGPTNGEANGAEGDSGPAMDAPASMVPEAEWSVNLSDTEQLSLSTAQIVEGYREGRLHDAFVWKDGMGDWVPLLECAELAPLLAPPAPQAVEPAAALAASPAASPDTSIKAEAKSVRPAARAIKPAGAAARAVGGTAARVTGGRAQGTQDLFAGVERAGADEEEVATSAPVLPQAAAARGDDKATGARNENSVLFSLDALKAGFSGGKSEPAAPKASDPARVSDDPFGMGSAPAAVGLGSGNGMFSLAANQALLTAPPPPDPPPQRATPAAVAVGAQPIHAPPPKRTLLFVGLGAAILAVGLALGIGLGGGKDEKSSGTAALDEKSTEKSKDEPKPSETKPDEPKKEEAKKEDAPKPAEEAKKDEPVTDPTAPPPDKTDTKPEPAKTGSTTQVTGKVATKEKEPKDDPKPPADVQPFSKGAAVAALSAASSSAASCKKIGGPTGSGKVQVTFAPSGRVTSANVSGPPFAGTSVGGCVASVFRRAKIPPFSGTQVTVSKSFSIR